MADQANPKMHTQKCTHSPRFRTMYCTEQCTMGSCPAMGRKTVARSCPTIGCKTVVLMHRALCFLSYATAQTWVIKLSYASSRINVARHVTLICDAQYNIDPCECSVLKSANAWRPAGRTLSSLVASHHPAGGDATQRDAIRRLIDVAFCYFEK